jgi:hypothetical protein
VSTAAEAEAGGGLAGGRGVCRTGAACVGGCGIDEATWCRPDEAYCVFMEERAPGAAFCNVPRALATISLGR